MTQISSERIASIEARKHVGGGPVTDNLWVSDGRQNLSRSLWILAKLRLRRELICLENANTPVL